ncbi:MAG: hypothetical protein ACRC8S_23055 [Fimbriiglobus sp.]
MKFLLAARVLMIGFWLTVAVLLNLFPSVVEDFTVRYDPTMVLCMRLLSVVLVLHNTRSLILSLRRDDKLTRPKPAPIEPREKAEEYNPDLDFTKPADPKP